MASRTVAKKLSLELSSGLRSHHTPGQYPSYSDPAEPNTSFGHEGPLYMLFWEPKWLESRQSTEEQNKTTLCPAFKARSIDLVGKLPRLFVQHIQWTAVVSSMFHFPAREAEETRSMHGQVSDSSSPTSQGNP